MKRFLSIILCLLLCLSLFACNDNTSEPDDNTGETENNENNEKPKEIIDKKYNLSEITDSLKLHGRSTVTSDGIICDTSAAGIEFNAYIEGTLKIELSISKSTYVDENGTNEAYFTLYVDGVRSEQRFKANSGENILTIANFEQGALHNIKLIKQTEAHRALCTMENIEFRGYFDEKPLDKELLIEFIGDSITVGYGNLCTTTTDSNCGQAVMQDATQTYAYFTAQKLDADLSLICCSGMGIAKGWRPFTADNFFAADTYYRNVNTKFIPDRVPDIVVINLGTNDQNKGATSTDFIQKTKALINLVRDTYGKDVKIVWVYNMMADGMQFLADKAIRDLGGEENGIYVCQLPREKKGGGGHPSIQGHTAAAEILASFIKDKGLD